MIHRILVTGGRGYSDAAHVNDTLDLYASGADVLAQGGASGADALAKAWAKEKGVRCVTYYADWSQHGRAAGPIRNRRMIEEFEPTLLIAFPGGRGTADMIRRADKAGIPVIHADQPKTK